MSNDEDVRDWADEKQALEAFGNYLIKLGQDIKSGVSKLSNPKQTRSYKRYWANGKWEFFPGPITTTLTYVEAEFEASEAKRLEAFLAANPDAELYDSEPDFKHNMIAKKKDLEIL